MLKLLLLLLLFCFAPQYAFAAEDTIKIYGIELGYIIKIVLYLLGLYASTIGTKWAVLKTKAMAVTKEKIKNEYIEQLILNLERTAFGVVENLYEERVRDLKVAAKDGKLTKAEVQELSALAIEQLKNSAGDLVTNLSSALNINGQSLNDLLLGEIRKAVQVNKTTLAVSSKKSLPRRISSVKPQVGGKK